MFAFVGETPLKVFHSLNFVLNDEMGSSGNSDLFVYGGFRNAKPMYEEIKKRGIFNHVYYFDAFGDRRTKFHKALTALQVFSPRRTLNRNSPDILDFSTHYQYICYAVSFVFSICILRGFHHDAVIGLEDGLSSYFGDVCYDNRQKSLILCDKLMPWAHLIEPYERMYLSNPEFYHGTGDLQVCAFPKVDAQSETGSELFDILGYRENTFYKNHKIVFLTQPCAGRVYADTETDCLNILRNEARGNAIVRVHPRQFDEPLSKYSAFFDVDDVNNIWELECLKQITDKHWLIGACSTAQIAPKLLCDREPHLVFLYRIFCTARNDAESRTRGDNIVNKFRVLYRDPDKIHVPETYEELRSLVKGLT